MEERAASRVYYVDWLRILAVLLLFPFHTLRVYNNEPFYVKGSSFSAVADVVINFVAVWHMPLFFLLAGCSTYFALKRRSRRQYSWERVKRLLVPFIFGILVLIPPQTWYGARFNSGYTDSFWHYLSSGDFLKWNIADGGDYYGGFGIGQLWFILWLFFISMIALPLIAWGVRGRGTVRMQALSRRLAAPAWWLVPIILFFIAEAAPELAGMPTVLYFFSFLLGFLVMCDHRFMETAERYRVPALGSGIALAVFWVASTGLRDSLPDPSWPLVGLAVLGAAATWLTIIGALGMGRRYLNRTSPAERYLAEASYPVYIIHQTMIVILGFYIVAWAVPEPVQWLVLLALAVVSTFVLYEVARRVSVLRFLLGMRPRRPAKAAETVLAGGAAGGPEAAGTQAAGTEGSGTASPEPAS